MTLGVTGFQSEVLRRVVHRKIETFFVEDTVKIMLLLFLARFLHKYWISTVFFMLSLLLYWNFSSFSWIINYFIFNYNWTMSLVNSTMCHNREITYRTSKLLSLPKTYICQPVTLPLSLTDRSWPILSSLLRVRLKIALASITRSAKSTVTKPV